MPKVNGDEAHCNAIGMLLIAPGARHKIQKITRLRQIVGSVGLLNFVQSPNIAMQLRTSCKRALRKYPLLPAVLMLSMWTTQSLAVGADDAKGLWLTDDGEAIVEFKGCLDAPAALCGRVVASRDAGQPDSACGAEIARLTSYYEGAWRDGWAFDPGDNKKYRATLRVSNGELSIRAYIGAEIFGQTERMRRPLRSSELPRCK